jgi:hypothetical protein
MREIKAVLEVVAMNIHEDGLTQTSGESNKIWGGWLKSVWGRSGHLGDTEAPDDSSACGEPQTTKVEEKTETPPSRARLRQKRPSIRTRDGGTIELNLPGRSTVSVA